MKEGNPIISIIILTYNAPEYVKETIVTLNEVTSKKDREKIEVIVWDNNSELETKSILTALASNNYIDKLHFSDNNLLFAGGNNNCVKLADPKTKYYLLLNSDVKIVSKDWISELLKAKERGYYSVASYGCCSEPPKRVDGYCYLIDKELYDKYPLDENFQWWWGITKQQAQLLNEGRNILGFDLHENHLIHWGGKSGVDITKIKGNSTEMSVILGWFKNSAGKVTFKLSPGQSKLKYLLNNIKVLIRRIKRSLHI